MHFSLQGMEEWEIPSLQSNYSPLLVIDGFLRLDPETSNLRFSKDTLVGNKHVN